MSALSPRQKFQATRKEMVASLIERDGEIDLVLTALLCRENPLLVGPPGTGKSLLLDSVITWMHGKRFTCLLTKFTTPEELFGPISVVGLKADRYVRITSGKMPEADGAFLDEVFKASSAILNTLLRILNERLYDNGDGTLRAVPLQLCVAASNEWPQSQDGGKELGALFDRFLFRRCVRPILSQRGRQRLLWTRDHTPKLSTSITPQEIEQARSEAMALPFTDQSKEALEAILSELARQGVKPGDRRQFKAISACQGFAYLAGSDRVEPEHLEILADVLWDDPAEQPEVVARTVAKIANPTGMVINQMILETEQILAGADPKNLAQAATATAKLQEIDKKLAALPSGNGRIVTARDYVRSEIKRLRLASLDAIS